MRSTTTTLLALAASLPRGGPIATPARSEMNERGLGRHLCVRRRCKGRASRPFRHDVPGSGLCADHAAGKEPR